MGVKIQTKKEPDDKFKGASGGCGDCNTAEGLERGKALTVPVQQ